MQKLSKRAVQDKKKKTPAKKKSPPKRKRKLPAKLTKANLVKVYNVVKYSGEIVTTKDLFGNTSRLYINEKTVSRVQRHPFPRKLMV